MQSIGCRKSLRLRKLGLLTLLLALVAPTVANAVEDVVWVDWQRQLENGDIEGVATVGADTVTVTYSGERAFVQYGCGTNYWNPSAPYISPTVPNAPPDCDIIALSQATPKMLSFSEPVANVFFAVVSLNGNGYRFDRDFEILSFGLGYWGNGTLTKVVNPPTYDLIGSGEPHGVIQLLGNFSTVSWSSLSNENWNGFTVGFENTVANLELCRVDEYVSDSACIACPAGTTNAAGDDPSGSDTSCDVTYCGLNEYVSGNACIACSAGTTNAAGDDASGPDTSCDVPAPNVPLAAVPVPAMSDIGVLLLVLVLTLSGYFVLRRW